MYIFGILIKFYNRSQYLFFLIFIKTKVMTTIVQIKLVKNCNVIDRNYECFNKI